MHRCIYLNSSGHQDVPLNPIKLTASTEVRKVKASFNNTERGGLFFVLKINKHQALFQRFEMKREKLSND